MEILQAVLGAAVGAIASALVGGFLRFFPGPRAWGVSGVIDRSLNHRDRLAAQAERLSSAGHKHWAKKIRFRGEMAAAWCIARFEVNSEHKFWSALSIVPASIFAGGMLFLVGGTTLWLANNADYLIALLSATILLFTGLALWIVVLIVEYVWWRPKVDCRAKKFLATQNIYPPDGWKNGDGERA